MPAPTLPPAEEALAWWQERVADDRCTGLRDDLPSPNAVHILVERKLVALTPGGWGFVVMGPRQESTDRALRQNYWQLVALALTELYAPAAIDRVSAVRLYTGDESVHPTLEVRHHASRSERRFEVARGYTIVLRPDVADNTTDPKVPGATSTRMSVSGAAVALVAPEELLVSLTAGDVRNHPELIGVWLRTLIIGYAPLERAYKRQPRPVLLNRMAHLARAVGNIRLADTIDAVLAAQERTRVARAHTGVGRDIVISKYVITGGGGIREPWLDRYRVNFLNAAEQLKKILAPLEQRMVPASPRRAIEYARAAKLDDTYHSTTIEGYRITRDEVEGVIAGREHAGKTPDEIEQLMALKGYAGAFDWTLERSREALESRGTPRLTEELILDLFLELWTPSIDAGVVQASDLRSWRKRAVQINGSDYARPSPEKLAPLMQQLVEQFNTLEAGPIVRATLVHWQFVHVHPFVDGNGRIGRLLMNYVLSGSGLAWTTIRGEERRTYFSALEAAHMRTDLSQFGAFIAHAVERANGAMEELG